jgi:hypothetical protein
MYETNGDKISLPRSHRYAYIVLVGLVIMLITDVALLFGIISL